ncbi:aspartate kinase [Clostridium sp. 19966]|uniref:aspartate kinase n=1 Tax=Clostridium sp. 19966 TaxID=2768166 RepID=UPI0028E02C3F|nr:aspartate kinase [Clostridium sp. 19966]MDT8718701.1 aspartate kinase [Clostridium sp. 19966]
MNIVVQKYGGSSVATSEKIKKVAETVIARKEKGNSMVVVVSAMGDTTDELISLAKEITENPDKREMDALLSTGEMVSSAMLAMAVNAMGHKAVSYSAYQLNIQTRGQYGKALIKDMDITKIVESLEEDNIVIVAGFQGVNDLGDITTLGRGGSDTSAVALAYKLKGSCEIYTDVDGIYACDPRKLKSAKKLSDIHYEEMLELASLGAQVMHSRSVELAEKYNIPIYVGLSCSDIKGTIIGGTNNMETKAVTGIATSNDDISITVKNISSDINIISELFGKIGERKINIDMISQTAPIDDKVNISFTIPKEDVSDCMEILYQLACKENIIIDEDITKFSIVGIGMKTTSGVAGKMFRLFSENNILVKMITTSEIRVTCTIKREDELKAIDITGEAFNLKASI